MGVADMCYDVVAVYSSACAILWMSMLYSSLINISTWYVLRYGVVVSSEVDERDWVLILHATQYN